jgi:uncharacterized protein YgbK (DUF1537 family)
VLVPANVSRGRTILGGECLVHGVPLHCSPFAHDPVHPALTSRMLDLLGESPSLHLPDAATPQDIASIAAGLLPGDLPAGASDFYSAITKAPDLPPPLPLPPGRRLWICGSPEAASTRLGQFRALGIPFVAPEPASDLNPSDLAEQTMHLEATSGRLALTSGTRAALTAAGTARMTAQIAEAAAAVILRWQPAIVFVEGGATSRAVLDRTGHDQFRVYAELAAGVVALQAWDNPGGTLFVVKPGSYDWPEICYQ